MGIYKHKPVVVEAWQVGSDEEQPGWLKAAIDRHDVEIPAGKNYWVVDTLEGTSIASHGDYIIQGVKGELYPCKPDVIDQLYDRVTPRASWTERLARFDAEYEEGACDDDDSLISALEKIMGSCRFCGEGRPFIDEAHTCDGTPLYYGMCPECGACGPVGHGPAEACNLWNWGTAAQEKGGR